MEHNPQPGERYVIANGGHPHSVLLPFGDYAAIASRRGRGERLAARHDAGPKRYRLAEDTIDQQDIAELVAWLESDPHLTQGELVREFERQWAEWIGARHAVFVNSGSSANLLMYYALLVSGRLKNRKVIVPSIAWATTVAPAIQLGFEPIMCEAEPETYGLDLHYLEMLARKHDPAAVIMVHVLGVPCKIDEILALRDGYGFHLMEDACAALGSRYDGRRVGTFGDLATFSFYFGHQSSTIEGGMICTDDGGLADVLRMVRAHGWANDIAPEKEAALAREHGVIEFNRRFTFYHPGFNVRSTDLNARIGLSQMKKIDRVTSRRMENHRRYQAEFAGTPFRVQRNDRADIASISFAIMAASAERRERIAAALRQNRIETRPLGGGSMARQPFWVSRYGAQALPFADRIHETCMHLPNHPGLSFEDIGFISGVVKGVPA